MNAERLHAIALEVRKDLSETNTPELLSQLAAGYRQLAQNPGDTTQQQQVASLRDQLDEALGRAPSNDFSPAWRQTVEELGVSDLLGMELRSSAQEIFDRNELTPGAAADAFDELAGRVQALGTSVDQLIAALEWFEIGAEELEYGEFEIGLLIPREAVEGQLKPLGRELLKLDQILLPFVELSTGSRPDFEVRSISSSEFQIFLDSPGATALLIATAIERIVTVYKKIIDIRVAKQKLKDAQASDEVIAAVTRDADQRMDSEIDVIADALVSEFGKDLKPDRANELRTALKVSLRELATRIDHGYNVDVRAGEPEADEEEPEEGDSVGDVEVRRYYEAVTSRREALSFINLEGAPILSLEEPKEEESSET